MPQDNSARKAFLIGAGIGSLASAAFLIRDGAIPGRDITLFESLPVTGGSLDGGGSAQRGYTLRGGRMLTTDNYDARVQALPASLHEGVLAHRDAGRRQAHGVQPVRLARPPPGCVAAGPRRAIRGRHDREGHGLRLARWPAHGHRAACRMRRHDARRARGGRRSRVLHQRVDDRCLQLRLHEQRTAAAHEEGQRWLVVVGAHRRRQGRTRRWRERSGRKLVDDMPLPARCALPRWPNRHRPGASSSSCTARVPRRRWPGTSWRTEAHRTSATPQAPLVVSTISRTDAPKVATSIGLAR